VADPRLCLVLFYDNYNADNLVFEFRPTPLPLQSLVNSLSSSKPSFAPAVFLLTHHAHHVSSYSQGQYGTSNPFYSSQTSISQSSWHCEALRTAVCISGLFGSLVLCVIGCFPSTRESGGWKRMVCLNSRLLTTTKADTKNSRHNMTPFQVKNTELEGGW
jgi:hypothetical protein